jgi:hypothetical protein
MPERARAKQVDGAARAALPAWRYEAEYARGAARTPGDLLAELTEALCSHPGGP